MKKIVAVAAAGIVLAGAAFADVSFTWKRTNIVDGTSKSLKDVSRTDCLGLELSNDIAGVVLDFDITDTQTIKKCTEDEPCAKSSEATTNLQLDSYYGWMTFGLPVGNLQVTSGKWTSRYADRVNVDAGDLDSDYFEAHKMGVINGFIALDSNNLTGNAMATMFAYTLADKLPGTLLVKGGFVDLSAPCFAADGNGMKLITQHYGSYGKFDSVSGFAAEVGYRQEDVINVNVAWRSFDSEAFSIGAFVSPLMVENLKATVGFSFGKSSADDADGSEMGVDLRARYAFTEKTAVTGMFNYSKTEFTKGADGEDEQAMWFMASVNHVAGDNISFKVTLNHTIEDLSAAKPAAFETAITPACVIDITEKAFVTAAFDMRWDGKTPYAGLGDVKLPIYVTIGL